MKYKSDLYLRHMGRIIRSNKRLTFGISNQKIGGFIWVKKESFLKDLWVVIVLRICLRKIGWCLGFPSGVQRASLRKATYPWWQAKRVASTESLPGMASDKRRSAALSQLNEWKKKKNLNLKVKRNSQKLSQSRRQGFSVLVLEIEKA
jgi:hypothetical protein